jgi:hypothetical protein
LSRYDAEDDMSDETKKSEGLTIKIKRVRTRLAAGVKTGGTIGSTFGCPMRTDPTENGEYCELTMGQGVTHCASSAVGA